MLVKRIKMMLFKRSMGFKRLMGYKRNPLIMMGYNKVAIKESDKGMRTFLYLGTLLKGNYYW